MHQTRMGNRWFFVMKARIVADTDSGLVHTVTTTAASEADVNQRVTSVTVGSACQIAVSSNWYHSDVAPA